MPGWAGEYAQALAEATETPPELAAGMVLSACATAVARRVKINIKPGYYEPCNLWTVVALPPGNRKSAVQSAATAPLVSWEKEKAEALKEEIQRTTSERKTLEARAKEVRNKAAKAKDPNTAKELAHQAAELEANLPSIPLPPQLWTTDATPEQLGSLLADHQESMAWLSSEGGIFDLLQGRYSNGIPNLDLILKAHSGDSDRVNRASRPPVFLNNPHLTIGLSPQPDVLQGLANKPGFRGRGLLARFLFLLPPSALGYRKLQSHPIPEDISANYQAGLHAMLNWQHITDESGNNTLRAIQLGESAHKEWHDFALYIEEQMRPGGDLEHFTDWAGKAPGAAARLAGVLHSIKHAHGNPWEAELTQATMNDALEIMAVITRHSAAALTMMGGDPTISAAQRVWAWIERREEASFTIREAFNALRSRFSRSNQLRQILEVLEERGYVQIIEPEQTGPGRPPSPRVLVRQEIRESWQ